MRIATANSYDTGVDTLQRRQSELSKLQEQMTSGKRVSRASDDPAAAARAERAMANVERSVTSQRAVDASKVAMAQTESTLGDAGELMQHARELLVAAGNGSYTDAERQSIANQIKGLR
ncbi:MAG: flagellar hook-associated protein 3, partial [Caldimonas sp.]